MVKNGTAVRRLEKSVLRNEKSDFMKNIQLVEALYREAVVLGAFPPKERLAGIDIDIRVARAINSVLTTPAKSSRKPK